MSIQTSKRAPAIVRCDWKRDATISPDGYRCPACDQWTTNLPLYRYDVCPAKDRRKGAADRREAL